MKKKNRYLLLFGALTALLLLFTTLNLFLGSVLLPFKELLAALLGRESSTVIKEILFNYRVPKVITAILSGVALSICGLQMQTLFRNPLADPFILGLSSGAGLGVAFLIMGFSAFGLQLSASLFSEMGVVVAAWLGALAVTLLILLVSSRLKESASLLIFGIMVASVAGSLISLMQYFSPSSELKIFVLWTMGSFSGLSSLKITILATAVAAGLLLSIFNIKELNALLLGESYARTIGVNIEKSRRRILIATTLLAGSVTAFCGPIGFIGIAVPHIARMLFKNADHKVLLPASALIGATMMVVADTISALPGRAEILPINSVSALLGAPVILVIILKSRTI